MGIFQKFIFFSIFFINVLLALSNIKSQIAWFILLGFEQLLILTLIVITKFRINFFFLNFLIAILSFNSMLLLIESVLFCFSYFNVLPNFIFPYSHKSFNVRNVRRWQGHWHYFNEESMRLSGVPQKEIGKKTIMVVGDSYVYGEGISENQRFSNLLQNFLGNQFQVINLGIRGLQISDIFTVTKKYIDLLNPVLVIYGMCPNDIGAYEENLFRDVYKLNRHIDFNSNYLQKMPEEELLHDSFLNPHYIVSDGSASPNIFINFLLTSDISAVSKLYVYLNRQSWDFFGITSPFLMAHDQKTQYKVKKYFDDFSDLVYNKTHRPLLLTVLNNYPRDKEGRLIENFIFNLTKKTKFINLVRLKLEREKEVQYWVNKWEKHPNQLFNQEVAKQLYAFLKNKDL